MRKTIFIAAGEVSGDMHGAALSQALLSLDSNLELVGMGGHQMRACGVRLIADVTGYSTIGFWEPLRYLPKLLSVYLRVKTWIAQQRPSLVILIDNQGLNLLLALVARSLGIPTCYYIAPQEWQWGTQKGGRKVAEAVDKILCIFPPEYQFYHKIGANARYVGHPILDTAQATLSKDEFCVQNQLDSSRPIVGIFPGSRNQELQLTAPILIQAAKKILASRPDVQIVVSVASPSFGGKLSALCAQLGLKASFCLDNRNLIAHSRLSLVTSGTVSLEHAVLGTPCLVAYQFSPFSYWFIKTFMPRVAGIKFMSMANSILDREVLPEFLQDKATPERLTEWALVLLQPDSLEYASIKRGLAELKSKMGEPGVVARAAKEILLMI